MPIRLQVHNPQAPLPGVKNVSPTCEVAARPGLDILWTALHRDG